MFAMTSLVCHEFIGRLVETKSTRSLRQLSQNV